MKRPARRTLIIIVAISLLAPALLLSLLGVKLLRDFTGISHTIRGEYGEYMAELAVASVEDGLWEQEQLNMVAARLSPPHGPAEVVPFLGRFQTENPLYLLAFFVVPEGLVHYSEHASGRTQDLRPLPSWILDPILDLLQTQRTMPSGLRHVAAPDSLSPAQVTFFTVHSAEGELLGSAGFVWDLEHVRSNTRFLERALSLELGANRDVFRGAFLQSPVSITLLDESEKPFFTTNQTGEPDFLARKTFGRVLPFYKVGVQLSDDRFESWVQGVVWTHLFMIASMFLVIVIAVVFSLRFVFHEMELAELKSTLVSNVSHELKTPLALIRLFSETLEMGRAGGPDKEKEFLRIIHKESDRLTHLINNVLDVGRIEQGRKTYQIQPIDLAQVVGETLDAYRYQLQQQGFRLESNIEDSLPPVAADPEAVTQALLNLMDNAIKYSTEKKEINVSLERRNGEAVISVADRGVGISAMEHARIFEKFYRVEKGLVHTVKGSGLGLALVKHIVDAHGGRVRVDSHPGKGSRFSIHLPLSQDPPDKSAARSGEKG